MQNIDNILKRILTILHFSFKMSLQSTLFITERRIMNFDKRLLIEENISTLIREINTYSVFVVGDNDFDTSKCKRLSKFPFVCHGCQSYFVC